MRQTYRDHLKAVHGDTSGNLREWGQAFLFGPGGMCSGTQPMSQEVEENTSRVVAAGEEVEEDMTIGDTIETEETVEQDRDETVRYIDFLNIKLIFVNFFIL